MNDSNLTKTEWVRLALSLADLKAKDLVPVEVLGLELVVCMSESGRLSVYHNRCSHQPIPLSDFGEIQGERLVCHAHGACFDLANHGMPLAFPAKTGLREVAHEVRSDGLYVSLGLGGAGA